MAGDDNVFPFPVPGEPSSSKAKGAPQFGVPDVMPFFAGAGHPFAPPTQKLLRKRPTRAALIVRLDLDDARPPIWRRLRLASDLPLSQLHDVIQTAMGWEDCHLHHFVMGPSSRDRPQDRRDRTAAFRFRGIAALRRHRDTLQEGLGRAPAPAGPDRGIGAGVTSGRGR